ncbi:hypothetical protein ALQ84_200276 [Pseudomonas caricapapayae]|uniref:Uncharacterized protein n=1 Tax=Pseudomonas caricapapayae TaxID=46678 RepID=A0A3M3BB09_9PSED|nr:hypothetical protein [Pseudomonas caricapapayae]KAA8686813.1 hypothetical protein F4W67_29065 [Pseudomonas caricapapayae]RMM09898.1 hypothetical protein ALQ84_200276 [Pseudomonas caricapapayae]
MSPITMIEGLSDAERELVIKGLQALRRERGFAWNVACDVAARSNVTVSPSLSLYGVVRPNRRKFREHDCCYLLPFRRIGQ